MRRRATSTRDRRDEQSRSAIDKRLELLSNIAARERMRQMPAVTITADDVVVDRRAATARNDVVAAALKAFIERAWDVAEGIHLDRDAPDLTLLFGGEVFPPALRHWPLAACAGFRQQRERLTQAQRIRSTAATFDFRPAARDPM